MILACFIVVFRKLAATERLAQAKWRTNVVFVVETTLTAEQLKEASHEHRRKLVRTHGTSNNIIKSAGRILSKQSLLIRSFFYLRFSQFFPFSFFPFCLWMQINIFIQCSLKISSLKNHITRKSD